MSQELREEARRREEEALERARQREEFERDVALVASRPEGVRFLRWFLEDGDIYAEDYQPGHMGAYQAGRRAAALRLWRILKRILPPRLFAAVTLPREFDGLLLHAEVGEQRESWKKGENE